MQTELEARLHPPGCEPVPETGRLTAAEGLSRSYTMHSERAVHSAAWGDAIRQEEVLDDVELF